MLRAVARSQRESRGENFLRHDAIRVKSIAQLEVPMKSLISCTHGATFCSACLTPSQAAYARGFAHLTGVRRAKVCRREKFFVARAAEGVSNGSRRRKMSESVPSDSLSRPCERLYGARARVFGGAIRCRRAARFRAHASTLSRRRRGDFLRAQDSAARSPRRRSSS